MFIEYKNKKMLWKKAIALAVAFAFLFNDFAFAIDAPKTSTLAPTSILKPITKDGKRLSPEALDMLIAQFALKLAQLKELGMSDAGLRERLNEFRQSLEELRTEGGAGFDKAVIADKLARLDIHGKLARGEKSYPADRESRAQLHTLIKSIRQNLNNFDAVMIKLRELPGREVNLYYKEPGNGCVMETWRHWLSHITENGLLIVSSELWGVKDDRKVTQKNIEVVQRGLDMLRQRVQLLSWLAKCDPYKETEGLTRKGTESDPVPYASVGMYLIKRVFVDYPDGAKRWREFKKCLPQLKKALAALKKDLALLESFVQASDEKPATFGEKSSPAGKDAVASGIKNVFLNGSVAAPDDLKKALKDISSAALIFNVKVSSDTLYIGTAPEAKIHGNIISPKLSKDTIRGRVNSDGQLDIYPPGYNLGNERKLHDDLIRIARVFIENGFPETTKFEAGTVIPQYLKSIGFSVHPVTFGDLARQEFKSKSAPIFSGTGEKSYPAGGVSPKPSGLSIFNIKGRILAGLEDLLDEAGKKIDEKYADFTRQLEAITADDGSTLDISREKEAISRLKAYTQRRAEEIITEAKLKACPGFVSYWFQRLPLINIDEVSLARDIIMNSLLKGMSESFSTLRERAIKRASASRIPIDSILAEANTLRLKGPIRKILIAEDERPYRRVYEEAVAMAFEVAALTQDVHVEYATNGKEAYEYLKGNPDVDLILTDRGMLYMEGDELIAETRASLKIRAPVIFISGAEPFNAELLEHFGNAMQISKRFFEPGSFSKVLISIALRNKQVEGAPVSLRPESGSSTGSGPFQATPRDGEKSYPAGDGGRETIGVRSLKAATWLAAVIAGLVVIDIAVWWLTGGFSLWHAYIALQKCPGIGSTVTSAVTALATGMTARLMGMYLSDTKIKRSAFIVAVIFMAQMAWRPLLGAYTDIVYWFIDGCINIPVLKTAISLGAGMAMSAVFDVFEPAVLSKISARSHEKAGDPDEANKIREDGRVKGRLRPVLNGIMARLASAFLQHALTQEVAPREFRVLVIFSLGLLNNTFRSVIAYTKKPGIKARNVLLWGLVASSICLVFTLFGPVSLPTTIATFALTGLGTAYFVKRNGSFSGVGGEKSYPAQDESRPSPKDRAGASEETGSRFGIDSPGLIVHGVIQPVTDESKDLNRRRLISILREGIKPYSKVAPEFYDPLNKSEGDNPDSVGLSMVGRTRGYAGTSTAFTFGATTSKVYHDKKEKERYLTLVLDPAYVMSHAHKFRAIGEWFTEGSFNFAEYADDDRRIFNGIRYSDEARRKGARYYPDDVWTDYVPPEAIRAVIVSDEYAPEVISMIKEEFPGRVLSVFNPEGKLLAETHSHRPGVDRASKEKSYPAGGAGYKRFAGTKEDPVENEKRRRSMERETENLKEDFLFKYGLLPDNDDITVYVRKVFEEAFGDEAKNYKVYVAPELYEITAMSFSDGTIIVSAYLLEFIEYKEELQAVLAHEAMHAKKRHIEETDQALENKQEKHIVDMALETLSIERMHEYQADLGWMLEEFARRNINPLGLQIFLERLDEYEKDRYSYRQTGFVHGALSDRALNVESVFYFLDMAALSHELNAIPEPVKKKLKSLPRFALAHFRLGRKDLKGKDLKEAQKACYRVADELPPRVLHLAIEAIGGLLLKNKNKVNEAIFLKLTDRVKTELFDAKTWPDKRERKIAMSLYYRLYARESLPPWLKKHPYFDVWHEGEKILSNAKSIEKAIAIIKDERFKHLIPYYITFSPETLNSNLVSAYAKAIGLMLKPNEKDARRFVRFSAELARAIEELYEERGIRQASAYEMYRKSVEWFCRSKEMKGRRSLIRETLKEFRRIEFRTPEKDSGRKAQDGAIKPKMAWDDLPQELQDSIEAIGEDLFRRAKIRKAFEISDYRDILRRISDLAKRYSLDRRGLQILFDAIMYKLPPVTLPMEGEKAPSKDSEIASSINAITSHKIKNYITFRLFLAAIDEFPQFKSLDKTTKECLIFNQLIGIYAVGDERGATIDLAKDGDGKLILRNMGWDGQDTNFFTSVSADELEDGSGGIISPDEVGILTLKDMSYLEDILYSIETTWLEPDRSQDEIVLIYKEMLNKSYTKPEDADMDQSVRARLFTKIVAKYIAKFDRWETFFGELKALESKGVPVKKMIGADHEAFGLSLAGLWRSIPKDPTEEELNDIYKAIDFVANPFLRLQLQNYYYERLWPSLSFDQKLDILFSKSSKGTFDLSRFNKLAEEDAHTKEELHKALDRLKKESDVFMSEGSRGAGIAALLTNIGIDKDRSLELLAGLLNSWEGDAGLKGTIYSESTSIQDAFDFSDDEDILPEDEDVQDRWMAEKIKARINRGEQISRTIYSMDHSGKYMLLRKMLAGDNGLLPNPEYRRRLLESLTRNTLESSGETSLQAVIDDVVKALGSVRTWKTVYFALQPFLLGRIAIPPEEQAEWEKVPRIKEDITGHLSHKYADYVIAKRRITRAYRISNISSPQYRRYPWRHEEGLLYFAEDALKDELARRGVTTEHAERKRLSPLSFVVEFVQNTGSMGVRFLQLLPQFVADLPEEYRAEFSKVYDSVVGQSKLTAMATLEREWPGLWDEIETIDERAGGGSLMTVYRVRTKDGRDEVIKVLNPNLKYLLKTNTDFVKEVLAKLKEKNPERYAFADMVVDEVKEWIERDVDFKGFIEKDKMFRAANNGFNPDGFTYNIYVPVSKGPANPYFMREEYIEGRNLTEWDELVKEGHDLKEITSLLVKNYTAQLEAGLVHSDVHIGNFRVTEDRRVAILDRSFFLELTPEMKGLIESIINPLALLSLSSGDILEKLIRISGARLTEPQRERAVEAIDGFVKKLKNGDYTGISELLVSLRQNGIKFPIELTLIFKNINSLQQMSRRAGFENLVEAYLYEPETHPHRSGVDHVSGEKSYPAGEDDLSRVLSKIDISPEEARRRIIMDKSRENNYLRAYPLGYDYVPRRFDYTDDEKMELLKILLPLLARLENFTNLQDTFYDHFIGTKIWAQSRLGLYDLAYATMEDTLKHRSGILPKYNNMTREETLRRFRSSNTLTIARANVEDGDPETVRRLLLPYGSHYNYTDRMLDNSQELFNLLTDAGLIKDLILSIREEKSEYYASQKRMTAAKTLAQIGLFDAAIMLVENKIRPEDRFDAQIEIGIKLAESGDSSRARTMLSEAATFYAGCKADSLKYLLRLIELQIAVGEDRGIVLSSLDEAEKKIFLNERSDDIYKMANLIELYFKMDPQKAKELMEKAWAQYVNTDLASRSSDQGEGSFIRLFDCALKLGFYDDAQTMLDQYEKIRLSLYKKHPPYSDRLNKEISLKRVMQHRLRKKMIDARRGNALPSMSVLEEMLYCLVATAMNRNYVSPAAILLFSKEGSISAEQLSCAITEGLDSQEPRDKSNQLQNVIWDVLRHFDGSSPSAIRQLVKNMVSKIVSDDSITDYRFLTDIMGFLASDMGRAVYQDDLAYLEATAALFKKCIIIKYPFVKKPGKNILFFRWGQKSEEINRNLEILLTQIDGKIEAVKRKYGKIEDKKKREYFERDIREQVQNMNLLINDILPNLDKTFPGKVPYAAIYGVIAAERTRDVLPLHLLAHRLADSAGNYDIIKKLIAQLLCPVFISNVKKRNSDYGKRLRIIKDIARKIMPILEARNKLGDETREKIDAAIEHIIDIDISDSSQLDYLADVIGKTVSVVIETIFGRPLKMRQDLSPNEEFVNAVIYQANMGNPHLKKVMELYIEEGPDAAWSYIAALPGNEKYGKLKQWLEGNGAMHDSISMKGDAQDVLDKRKKDILSDIKGELEELARIIPGAFKKDSVDINKFSPETVRLFILGLQDDEKSLAKDAIKAILHHLDEYDSLEKTLEKRLAENVVVYTSTDPVEILNLGAGFTSCLSIFGGHSKYALPILLDLNKRVVYVKDSAGKRIARINIMLTDQGIIPYSRIYNNTTMDAEDIIIKYLKSYADKLGVPLIIPTDMSGAVKGIEAEEIKVTLDMAVSRSIYDDICGSVEFGYDGKGKEITLKAQIYKPAAIRMAERIKNRYDDHTEKLLTGLNNTQKDSLLAFFAKDQNSRLNGIYIDPAVSEELFQQWVNNNFVHTALSTRITNGETLDIIPCNDTNREQLQTGSGEKSYPAGADALPFNIKSPEPIKFKFDFPFQIFSAGARDGIGRADTMQRLGRIYMFKGLPQSEQEDVVKMICNLSNSKAKIYEYFSSLYPELKIKSISVFGSYLWSKNPADLDINIIAEGNMFQYHIIEPLPDIFDKDHLGKAVSKVDVTIIGEENLAKGVSYEGVKPKEVRDPQEVIDTARSEFHRRNFVIWGDDFARPQNEFNNIMADIYTLVQNAFERIQNIYRPEPDNKRYTTAMARLLKAAIYLNICMPDRDLIDTADLESFINKFKEIQGPVIPGEYVGQVIYWYEIVLAKYESVRRRTPAAPPSGIKKILLNHIISEPYQAMSKSTAVEIRELISSFKNKRATFNAFIKGDKLYLGVMVGEPGQPMYHKDIKFPKAGKSAKIRGGILLSANSISFAPEYGVTSDQYIRLARFLIENGVSSLLTLYGTPAEDFRKIGILVEPHTLGDLARSPLPNEADPVPTADFAKLHRPGVDILSRGELVSTGIASKAGANDDTLFFANQAAKTSALAEAPPITNFLQESNIPFSLLKVPAHGKTPQDALGAVKGAGTSADLSQIIKTIAFTYGDGKDCVFVLPGDRSIDVNKMGNLTGKGCHPAADVESLTGYLPGQISPIIIPYKYRPNGKPKITRKRPEIRIDTSILQHPERDVYLPSGDPEYKLVIKVKDLIAAIKVAGCNWTRIRLTTAFGEKSYPAGGDERVAGICKDLLERMNSLKGEKAYINVHNIATGHNILPAEAEDIFKAMGMELTGPAFQVIWSFGPNSRALLEQALIGPVSSGATSQTVEVRPNEAIPASEPGIVAAGDRLHRESGDSLPMELVPGTSIEGHLEREKEVAVALKDDIIERGRDIRKDDSRKVIVALGKRWIPGYKKESSPAQSAYLSRLIITMRQFCEERGIPFIDNDESELEHEIAEKKAHLKGQGKDYDDAKIVVLADVESLEKELRALQGNERAFMVGIDGSQLTDDSYIRIVEVLRMALKLSDNQDLPPHNPGIEVNKPDRFWIFTLKAEPFNIDILKRAYETQIFA